MVAHPARASSGSPDRPQQSSRQTGARPLFM
jgi:hypothetical protein